MRTNVDRLLMHIANQTHDHEMKAYTFFRAELPLQVVYDELCKACITPQTALLGDVKSPAIKAVQIWKKCIKKEHRDYTDAFDVLCEFRCLPNGEEIAGKIIHQVFDDNVHEVPMYFVHQPTKSIEPIQRQLITGLASGVIHDGSVNGFDTFLKDVSFDHFMEFLICLGAKAETILVDHMYMTKEAFDGIGRMSMPSCINILRKFMLLYQSVATGGDESSLVGKSPTQEALRTKRPDSEIMFDLDTWVDERQIPGLNAFKYNEAEYNKHLARLKNYNLPPELLNKFWNFIVGKESLDDIKIVYDNIDAFACMLVMFARKRHLEAFGIPCTEPYYPAGAVQIAKTVLSKIPQVGTNEETKPHTPDVKQQDPSDEHAINFRKWCLNQPPALGSRAFTLTRAEHVANLKYIEESHTPIETLDWINKVITTGKNPTWPHFPVMLNIGVFASMLRLVATKYSLIAFKIPCINDYHPEEAIKMSRIILARVREYTPEESFASWGEAMDQTQGVKQMKLTAEQCVDLGLHLMTARPELFTQLCQEISEKKIARQSLANAMTDLTERSGKVGLYGDIVPSTILEEIEHLISKYKHVDIIDELIKANPALAKVNHPSQEHIVGHFMRIMADKMNPHNDHKGVAVAPIRIDIDGVLDQIKKDSFNRAAPTGDVFHSVTDFTHLSAGFYNPENVGARLGCPAMNPNQPCEHCGQIHPNYGRRIFINLDGKK